MKKLRKIAAAMTAGILLTASASAATYTRQADELNQLGLFLGTENGYELESTFTRAQGATMLVRLLGKEQEALSKTPGGAFADVPAGDWSAPYVEYCFENGITKGTGDGAYSPENAMSGGEYITLVLRALGYQYAEPENADIPAAEYGLLSSVTARGLVSVQELERDRMVYISHQALKVKMPDGRTLIEKLIAEQAVDRAIAVKLGLVK